MVKRMTTMCQTEAGTGSEFDTLVYLLSGQMVVTFNIDEDIAFLGCKT